MKGQVEQEARSVAEANRLTRQKLAGQGNLNIRDRFLLDALAVADKDVVSHDAGFYTLPSHAAKILKQPALAELNEIFGIVRQVNDQMVGMPASQARILLNGDERVLAVNLRLRTWAEQYCRDRLAKRNARDDNDPMARFQRIYYELLPDLERIGFAEDSVHPAFLAEFMDYLPWALYCHTWRDKVEFRRSEGKLGGQFRVLTDSLVDKERCEGTIQLYAWDRADDLERVMELLQDAGVHGESCTPERARDQLAGLLSDILEMKPFLLRNFKPEKCLVELGGLVFIWSWATGGRIGLVPVAESERQALEMLHKRQFLTMLRVLHDGHLACDATPWIDTDAIPQEHPAALTVNLRILECFHAKLFSFYERVDISGILERLLRSQADDTDLTEENVAASCQLIGEFPEPDEDEEDTTPVPAQIRTVRMQRLLGVLDERLGCEVRSGKGSEVVIFRSGGHHFRLGHHKRNTHVPSLVIKGLLQHVGISFREWLAAIS